MSRGVWLAACVLALLLAGRPGGAQQPEASAAEALRDAEARWRASPGDEAAAIWYARRLGYVGRHEDAVDVLTSAMERLGPGPRLLRHRGHRFISLRRFDEAIGDLERAAAMLPPYTDEVEPDGAPNRLGIPRSTLRFNVLYHLALAHYLRGDLPAAREAWRRCLDAGRRNDDMLVATTNWLYVTERRLGNNADAAALLARIEPGMCVVEDVSYLRLLLMHKGVEGYTAEALETGDVPTGTFRPDAATLYGVGVRHLLRGDRESARRVWSALVERERGGAGAASFGVIAAEQDLARLDAAR